MDACFLVQVLCSPSVEHSVPCHSREASLEVASNVDVVNDHSALFVVGSESQIAPLRDAVAHERTNPTSVLLESVLGAQSSSSTHPTSRPMVSLLVRCDRVHPSTAAVHRSRRTRASPDAFYGSPSLSVLHSADSFRRTENSPRPAQLTTMGIRRCSSLPSSGDAHLLEDRGFLESSPLECNDATQLITSSQSRINSSTTQLITSITDSNNGDIAELPSSSTALANDLTSVVHSPDQDSPSRQLLYDDYLGHYSLAGRGYPHGFGHCLEHSALPNTVLR